MRTIKTLPGRLDHMIKRERELLKEMVEHFWYLRMKLVLKLEELIS